MPITLFSIFKVFPLFVEIAVKAGNLIRVCQLYSYLAKKSWQNVCKRSLKGNNAVFYNRRVVQMVASEPMSIT